MTDRHAYLIMCHTNFKQLNDLLEIIDDERNDIYLHIDKKRKDYLADDIKKHVKKGRLIFIKPMRVTWGGDSQIRLELRLLKEAVKVRHQYYHLISGLDLPLKTQDEMHSFFSEQKGREFVETERIYRNDDPGQVFIERMNYYYPLQNFIGKKDRVSALMIITVQRILKYLQKWLHVSRIRRSGVTYAKGSNWFSITHLAAKYIADHYEERRHIFRSTVCGDEFFVQTMLHNSPLKDHIVNDNLRYIDWKRGRPYVFREEDYDLLMNSDKMFARKFDMNVDPVIIRRIKDAL